MMFSYYISFVKYYFFVETVFWRLRGCACVRPLCRSYGTERAQIFTGHGRGVGLHDGILATVESARMCARARESLAGDVAPLVPSRRRALWRSYGTESAQIFTGHRRGMAPHDGIPERVEFGA